MPVDGGDKSCEDDDGEKFPNGFLPCGKATGKGGEEEGREATGGGGDDDGIYVCAERGDDEGGEDGGHSWLEEPKCEDVGEQMEDVDVAEVEEKEVVEWCVWIVSDGQREGQSG